MNLKDPIEKLPLVGPTYAKRLEKLGIRTIEDLLSHFPFRYDDFSLISPIFRVQPGEIVTVSAQITEIKNEYTKNAKKIQKATLVDASGQIEAIWFNQPFLIKNIKIGEQYQFSGKIDWFGRQKVLLSPEYELLTPTSSHNSTHIPQPTLTTIHTGRLVPIYNETYGISSKWLRSRIRSALELTGNDIEEFLPSDIINNNKLLAENLATEQIHFPKDKDWAENARYRLAFDELFLIQLSSLQRKKEWRKQTLSKKFILDQSKIQQFIEELPFELTNAQKRCLEEIIADLQKEKPMNRLLEGDVGSGKTVVAAAASYVAFLNGYQTLYMAPTEILANQHFQTFQTFLGPLGVPIELITGSHKSRSKIENKPMVIVGTHSLFYQDFDPQAIGLVIIDEQHHFGVEQRVLLAKKGKTPHFLTMTATPIPRTIALTLYGDLDLSVIDEMPPGRLKVKTWVVPKEKRKDAYVWIKKRIKDTPEQAFIICPLIEESENLSSVRAVTKEFSLLSQVVFPDLRLGLLHGRIKSLEKDKLLTDFKEGKLDILVATPVVEVGIDIPNATIMLIEAAERFGLAQLHQLRGRVGRKDLQSYCLLFTENETPPVIQRLKSLEKTNRGMELAEIDLQLRGPGEIYGTKQHGFPNLKVASLTDLSLIQKTKQAAERMVAENTLNSALQSRLQKYKIEAVSN